MLRVFATLFKDSLVYGVANIIQKLTPVVIIPIITGHLGKEALTYYDLSFVYTYLFTPLIVLGLDTAASVFYFDKRNKDYSRQQVLSHAFWMQIISLVFYGAVFYPFRHQLADALFSNDAAIKNYWLLALFVTPGYLLLNYGLSILLWQRRKGAYVTLCFLQTLFTIGGVYAAVVLLNKNIGSVLSVVIGSITVCGLLAMLLVWKEAVHNPFRLDAQLLKRLLLFGLPFGLTIFFRQLIPSIDRFFILRYNFDAELPQYILAAKVASAVSTAAAAFVLAFTPYSLDKLNQDDAETEISELFRIVSILAFTAIPVLLLFKDLIVQLFADTSYGLAAHLFPYLFFGWVFDLFTYFTMLGIYRSQKSGLVLGILIAGTAIISALNILLVPIMGAQGAALSFCLAKASVFLVTLAYLKRFFNLRVNPVSFSVLLVGAVLLSFMVYRVQVYGYLALLSLFMALAVYFLLKTSRAPLIKVPADVLK